MFNLSKAARALITATFVITAVTGAAGSRAVAAPEQGCSGVADARNDAVKALHDAWKDANDKLDTLKALAKEELATLKDLHEVRDEVRGILRDARKDLDDVGKDARQDISKRAEAAFDLCGGDEDKDEAKTITTVDLTKLTADLTAIVEQAKKDFDGVLKMAAADIRTVIDKAKADEKANKDEKNNEDKKDHDKKDHDKKDHDKKHAERHDEDD